MKKIFLTFTAIFLLEGCSQNAQEQNLEANLMSDFTLASTSELKIGFCPTMKKDALALQEENQNLKLVPFGSAGEVLQNLKAENINLALVGRKAKSIETNENILEKNLETKEKYTLINQQKQMIAERDLLNLQIKTCLDENVENQFPELNLTFAQTCDYSNGEMWLISWVDFSDEMDLLIPMNAKGEKVRKFRNAFLYGKNFNNLNF